MSVVRCLCRPFHLMWGWSFVVVICGCSSSVPVASNPEQPRSEEVRTATTNVSWSAWRQDELANDEFSPEEGFRALSFADFKPYFAKPPKADAIPTWKAVGSAIVCTGKPKGYLYSTESFKDFTLRLELRFAPSAISDDSKKSDPNSGVMLYITEPHKQWPKSLEVQGRFSELATIRANGKAADVTLQDDPAMRESARKPADEWNGLELHSKAGALIVLLNGQKVCESQPSDVSEGPIGLQSEDFEVHFRRLRIRPE